MTTHLGKGNPLARSPLHPLRLVTRYRHRTFRASYKRNRRLIPRRRLAAAPPVRKPPRSPTPHGEGPARAPSIPETGLETSLSTCTEPWNPRPQNHWIGRFPSSHMCIQWLHSLAMSTKDAGLRIRIDRDLRERFLDVCRAQTSRGANYPRFMREYVDSHEPANTVQASMKSRKRGADGN